jgi:hypothetical protein
VQGVAGSAEEVNWFLALLGVLAIAICSVILLVSGFCAIVFFKHTEISVPLILTAVVCAAIIFGILMAMRKGRR